jgi:hypothetical protein
MLRQYLSNKPIKHIQLQCCKWPNKENVVLPTQTVLLDHLVYMLFVKKAPQNRAHKIFLLGRSMSEWRKTINITLLFNTCGFNDSNINVNRK